MTDDAVPATLIDLAARNVVDIEQRGPGVFYVRLREADVESLTRYERRVLDHLRASARDGVVPAEALTTGPQSQSARWMRGFVSGVVSDAQARGLSREAVGERDLHGAHRRCSDPGRARRGRRGSSRPGVIVVRRGVRAPRLDQAPAPAAGDAGGNGRRVALARRSRRARREPGVRDALAAPGRAVGSAARVRRCARRRFRRESPAPDGRRVGHGGVERVRRSVATRAHLVPAPVAARLGSGSDSSRCSSAWRSPSGRA